MNLSEKEEKFLLRFENYLNRIYLNYIVIGLLLCIAIAGLIIGIKLKAKDGFLMAIFFSTLGVSIFVVSRVYQNFLKIIEKMKQTIEELESRK